jgi:hypothetical protein
MLPEQEWAAKIAKDPFPDPRLPFFKGSPNDHHLVSDTINRGFL